MNRRRKRLILAAGIPVAVVVLALVALRLFLPLDRIKDMATARLGEQLGREVTIASAGLSLRGGLGIELQDVVVADPPGAGGGRVLEAAGFDLKLELAPLLKQEVRIHRLVVRSPRITLWKLADGSDNFTFVETATDPSAPDPGSAPGAEAAAAVSVATLEIRDGSLTYRDEGEGTAIRVAGLSLKGNLDDPAPGTYRSRGRLDVDSLLVTVTQDVPLLKVGLDYDVGYDLADARLTLHEGTFDINGFGGTLAGVFTAAGDDSRADGHLTLSPVGLQEILALVPAGQREPLADLTLAGRVSLAADLDWDPARAEPLAYSGQATATGLTVEHRDVSGELRADLHADFAPDVLDLRMEQGSFAGEPLRVTAAVRDFKDPRLEANLVGVLDLALAQPFLPADLEAKASGRGNFDLAISGRTAAPESLLITGDVGVSGGRLEAARLPEPITRLDAALVLTPVAVVVQRCTAEFPSGELRAGGRIEHPRSLLPEAVGPTPRLDLALAGNLDLAILKPFLPPELEADLGGRGIFDVTVAGRADNPADLRITGDLAVTEGRLETSRLPEPVTRLEAALVLAPDLLTLQKFEVEFPSGDVAVTGSMDHPLSFLPGATGPMPHLEFAARSRRFDVDKLFPAAAPASGTAPPPAAAGSNVAAAAPPQMPDLTAAGTFQVETLVYSHVEFTEVKGKATYRDRRVACDPVTARVYTGRAAGKIYVDLQNLAEPRYAGEFQATQIEANDFVSRFSRFGGTVFGQTELNGRFTAAGRDPERIKETLTLDADLGMASGRVVTTGFVESSLGNLAQKAGVSLDREQVIKDLATKVKVQDGKVKMDRMRTRLGTFGDLTIDGHYSFTGNLAYGGGILLTPETTKQLLSQSGVIGDLLGSNAPERLNLPLSIGGTFAAPVIALDYSPLAEELGRSAAEEAGNKLGDLLKKLGK